MTVEARRAQRPGVLRRLGRLAAWISGGLALLAMIAALAVWLLARASLPKVDGTIGVAGLEAPAEIARDRHGIPTIRASGLLDAVFAQGFVHAQDRLFQMMFQRRTAAGRLSEVLGARTLEVDRFFRTLGLDRQAGASVAHLDPATRAWLDAYAAGVNAFLATNDRPLPPEFLIFRHVDLEPWTAADSLVVIKLMALTLDTNLWDEIQRAQLARRLSQPQVEALWPDDPPGTPITLSPSEAPAGSNVWVVDGHRTTTGAPLLANDPHLGLKTPGTFYLARLEAPGHTLVGATLPGVPGIVVGHNGHLAWGFTTPGIDTQDLFLERVDPARPDHYATPDGWAPFAVREETIEVRGGDPVTVEVRATRHGPVLSDARPDVAAVAGADEVVALAWPALADDDTTIEALHRINLARDRAEAVDALRWVVAPPQNVAFADADGIGFFTPGRVPIRRSGNGVQPVPGWTGAYDWIGWIPFEELPQALDSAHGVLVNANNRLVGDDYPHFLAAFWQPAHRARRIVERLAARAEHDLDSFASIQDDVVSNLARDLLPFLEGIDSDDRGVVEAIARLRAWDGKMAADAAEPLLFSAWYRQLSVRLFSDELGRYGDAFGRGRPRFVRQVLAADSPWCDDVLTEPIEDCSTIIEQALEAALAELNAEHGDPADWRWGEAHRAVMEHPLLGRVPLAGSLFGIEVPTGGDGSTVNVGHFAMMPGAPFANTHAASFRGLYDLADLAESRFVIPSGQSGHPLSPHFADLTTLWAAGRTIRIAGGSGGGGGRLELRPLNP